MTVARYRGLDLARSRGWGGTACRFAAAEGGTGLVGRDDSGARAAGLWREVTTASLASRPRFGAEAVAMAQWRPQSGRPDSRLMVVPSLGAEVEAYRPERLGRATSWSIRTVSRSCWISDLRPVRRRGTWLRPSLDGDLDAVVRKATLERADRFGGRYRRWLDLHVLLHRLRSCRFHRNNRRVFQLDTHRRAGGLLHWKLGDDAGDAARIHA